MTRLLHGTLALSLLATPLAAHAPAPFAPQGPNPAAAPVPLILAQDDKADEEALQAFLPPELDGWTRQVITEIDAAQLAMIGGGSFAQALYTGPNSTVEIAMVIDAPFVQQMAPMFANTAMLAMAGEVVEVDGNSFVSTDPGEFVGLIGGRVMININGRDPEAVRAYLEQIDFDAIEGFGAD